MGDEVTCEVCGRVKASNGTPGYQSGICFGATLDDRKCYRIGYERSQAALAAARRECEGLRTKIAKALGCEPSASYDDMARGIGSLVLAVHDLNRKCRHLREDLTAALAGEEGKHG